MFQFDNIEELQKYDNKRVVLTVQFDDSTQQDFFGKLKIINDDFYKLITLKNDSNEYAPIE